MCKSWLVSKKKQILILAMDLINTKTGTNDYRYGYNNVTVGKWK